MAYGDPNSWHGLGRVGNIRVNGEGDSMVVTLSVATDYHYTKGKGDDQKKIDETEWHTVKLFGHDAKFASEHLKKGDSVFVDGRLRYNKYKKAVGGEEIEITSAEIHAEVFTKTRSKSAGEGGGEGGDGGGE